MDAMVRSSPRPRLSGLVFGLCVREHRNEVRECLPKGCVRGLASGGRVGDELGTRWDKGGRTRCPAELRPACQGRSENSQNLNDERQCMLLTDS